MNEEKFLADYIELYNELLINNDIKNKLISLKNKFLEVKK